MANEAIRENNKHVLDQNIRTELCIKEFLQDWVAPKWKRSFDANRPQTLTCFCAAHVSAKERTSCLRYPEKREHWFRFWIKRRKKERKKESRKTRIKLSFFGFLFPEHPYFLLPKAPCHL